MRFSRVAMVYFFTGATMFASGVIPASQVGLVSVWVDSPADPSVNESAVAGGSGMLNNLIGPVRSALDTIVGGSLLAVWGAIDALLGYYAWPMTVAGYLNAPAEVVLMSAALVAAFTFGVLRIFKASL